MALVAVAVTVVLPALRTHHFSSFYKPVEVHKGAARHCSVNLNDERDYSAIDRAAVKVPFTGLLAAPVRIGVAFRPAPRVSPVRLICLLKRLRLGINPAPDLPVLA